MNPSTIASTSIASSPATQNGSGTAGNPALSSQSPSSSSMLASVPPLSVIQQKREALRNEIAQLDEQERLAAENEVAKRRELVQTLPGYIGVADLREVLRLIQSVLIRQGQAAKRQSASASTTGKRAASGKRASAGNSSSATGNPGNVLYGPETKELWLEAFRNGGTVSEVGKRIGGSPARLARFKKEKGLVGRSFKRNEERLKELFASAKAAA